MLFLIRLYSRLLLRSRLCSLSVAVLAAFFSPHLARLHITLKALSIFQSHVLMEEPGTKLSA